MVSLENTVPLFDVTRKCYVCLAVNAKYTCPRCNIIYCSLDCYKNEKHEQCSESFYKECFVNDLKQRSVPEHEKIKVLEMLERVEEENPIDDFLDADDRVGRSLEDRLHGLDIDNLEDDKVDDLWERLSPGEKEEFKRSTSSGNFLGEDVAKPWQPWWLEHSSELVIEIGADKNVSTKIKIIQVLPITTLLPSGKSASPFVPFNLTNCLYPYLFFQRLYNGCGVEDFCEEFSESSVLSSEFLDSGKTFQSAEEALINAQDRCVKNSNSLDIEVSEEFVNSCVQDVSHVFVGRNVERCNEYVMMALSELHSACTHCRKILKSKNSETGTSFRKHLFGVVKKLEFMLAWCSEYKSQFPVLALEIAEIYKIRKHEEKSNSELKNSVQELRAKVKDKTLSKPLIVEID